MSKFWVIYILECFETENNEPIENCKYIGCKKSKHDVVFIKYNWIPVYYMIHICMCIYYT